MTAPGEPLLSIRDLSVAFGQGARQVLAVDRVSFDIAKGETVALVGESGSGKSVTALSVMKLLPYPPAHHPSGSIRFKGEELLTMPEREIRRVRGNDITIVFQEPMTSLNPLHTIEKQIAEILLLHRGVSGAAARARIVSLLDQVGIPDPASRLGSYPHQLSGGQRQRVMIAMALANEPDLLIADEPTTALDVTVQAQILKLLKDTQTRLGMSMLFITHDLGIVRKLADRVCVMTQGKIVEQGAVERVFTAPEHAYTKALLAAEPRPDPAPPSVTPSAVEPPRRPTVTTSITRTTSQATDSTTARAMSAAPCAAPRPMNPARASSRHQGARAPSSQGTATTPRAPGPLSAARRPSSSVLTSSNRPSQAS